jgi:ferredoxin
VLLNWQASSPITTMFSRISRLGFRILNETRVAQNSVTKRSISRCPDQNRCFNPMTRYFFSTGTTTSDKAQADGNQSNETISVTFVDKEGEEKHIKVPIGMSMLEAAHENDIELEGACEGSLACSTCHVIVMDVNYYNKLEDPTDEENDMLDLAFGLTETSRLGCQVIAKPELDGLRLALPAATRNFAVDGYVPKPH